MLTIDNEGNMLCPKVQVTVHVAIVWIGKGYHVVLAEATKSYLQSMMKRTGDGGLVARGHNSKLLFRRVVSDPFEEYKKLADGSKE